MKGWSLIIASLAVTWGLYLQAKVNMPAADWAQAIAQLTGLLGMVLLSWSYLLAARHSLWERLFGGLDRAYKAHHIVGGMSFVLLLQHPIAMIIGSLPRNALLLYLVPFRAGWDYTTGQLALYVLLLLLVLTLYVPLSYRVWKWTHEWMGLVIFLGGIHGLLIVSDVSRSWPLRVYILAFASLALLSALYKRFLYYVRQRQARVSVKSVGVAQDLIVLSLAYEGKPLTFGPGQYGFFAFPDAPRDEHPFSLLGSDERVVIIGVKRLGHFTKRLAKLQVGEPLIIRGPFGTFAEQMATTRHAVWIAGGIGITPFLSMARTVRASQRVEMYFCAKVLPPPVLTEPFRTLERTQSSFTWQACETSKTGRLKAAQILAETGNDPRARYFLCGPTLMMEGLTKELVQQGVKRSHIIYEDFAFK